ncbi:MAG TPA: helix-turn-helix domain-containing protein [Candidatus Scybalocola faecigallinarum]|uniref:Helix-turn-helix domain-containing protein n=1 Tax=Candidatus Scybalocola faecigallinarum TaxID=2840941 RepID=A0A9D1F4C4_9FIRM|nr:helix-turn-helix domain-containing protein [Candidatus Scybalocola faecigallinarum]
MDQMKIGAFLKELRKEKNLTQQQLAEQLNVSGRTVSRWETGTNMPDISILVDLAKFYDVSIPEIIDGGRRSEKMNEEVKETALKLSDYAETINQKIKIRLFWLTIIALLGMIAFIVIEALGLDTPGSLYERIASAGLGLDFGMLIVIAMYLSGVLGKIKARRMMRKNARKLNQN